MRRIVVRMRTWQQRVNFGNNIGSGQRRRNPGTTSRLRANSSTWGVLLALYLLAIFILLDGLSQVLRGGSLCSQAAEGWLPGQFTPRSAQQCFLRIEATRLGEERFAAEL